jgi:hypothetical protein
MRESAARIKRKKGNFMPFTEPRQAKACPDTDPPDNPSLSNCLVPQYH